VTKESSSPVSILKPADHVRSGVRLDADQYDVAMEAHRREASLRVQGRLEKENNLWWLYDAFDVEIVDSTLRPGQRFEAPCTGRKLGYWCWPGLSCCRPVLVDQPCQPGVALDPGGRDGAGDDVWIVARCAQEHVLALVAAAGVVVADVVGQDHAQVPLAGDEHLVGALSPCRADEAFRVGVHPGCLGRDRQYCRPDRGEHGVGCSGELRVPIADQVSEPASGLLQVGGKVAGQLCGPLAARVSGDPEQVHSPCPVFDDERDIQAPQRDRAVDVEEIGSQERVGVGAQEHAPGSVVPRWRRDAVHPQGLADGGGGYPVAEPAQLALDPDHAPPGVLPGQAHDQRDELVGDRRAARWPGLAPLGRSQALMPAEQRAGSHDPPSTQALGHDPVQRGEDGPVGPGHARSGVGTAQHGYLVPQREDLHVFGRRGPGQQRKPGQHGHQ